MKFIKVALLFLLAVVLAGCAQNGAWVLSRAQWTPGSAEIIDRVNVTWDDSQEIKVDWMGQIGSQASDFVSGVSSEFREHAASEISRRLATHGVSAGNEVQMKLTPLHGSFGSSANGGYVDIGVVVESTRSATLSLKTTIRVYGKFGVDKALLLSFFTNRLIEELLMTKMII
jgi:hypothetical protein